MSTTNTRHVLPKSGMLFHEQTLAPVLCKPKLMPLKSVTLEKLEKMQAEAQAKMWEAEMQEKPPAETANVSSTESAQQQASGEADVWRADDEDNNDTSI